MTLFLVAWGAFVCGFVLGAFWRGLNYRQRSEPGRDRW